MASTRWGTDFGILRKKEPRDEDFFVFGYSCKIFDDPEKALFIDLGKHLIPWMGDEKLKIDRYDCRGALNDLTPYLSKFENHDRWAGYSAEERRVEELCDKERYKSLYSNDSEDNIFQEEELKRLHKGLRAEKSYSEVGYNYNEVDRAEENNPADSSTLADDNEPFIPPPFLDLPVGMKIPETKKQHEIIEKTALFINQQGPQMEVLLKIKQTDNPQFKFLSFDDELYPYYRHLLMAVKNKNYKSDLLIRNRGNGAELNTEEISPNSPVSSSTITALLNSTSLFTAESAPVIPAINYKPSADCSYSALVNRIKETVAASSLLDENRKKNSISRSPSPENESSGSSCSSSKSKSRSRKSETHADKLYQSFEKQLEDPLDIPLSTLSKSARRRRIKKEKRKAAEESYKVYYVEEPIQNDEQPIQNVEPPIQNGQQQEQSIENNIENDDTKQSSLVPESSLPMPAVSPPLVQLPPPVTQLIIDKMASYVAKNGRSFEEIVRIKGDPRFSFLQTGHIYNPYYNQKVDLYLQLEAFPETANIVRNKPCSISTNELGSESELEQEAVVFGPTLPQDGLPNDPSINKKKRSLSKSSKHHKPVPICFSIKKPREQETLEIKSALPYEESENEGNNSDSSQESWDENEANNKTYRSSETEVEKKIEGPLDMFEQDELPKKTVILPEKWEEERKKAKLVTVAKEKLAAKTKDKQLQAERRKRAAEFINSLQKDNLMNNIHLLTSSVAMLGNEESQKKDNTPIIEMKKLKNSDSNSVITISSSDEKDTKKRTHRSSHKEDGRKRHKKSGYHDSDSNGDVDKHSKKRHRHHRSSSRRRFKHHRSEEHRSTNDEKHKTSSKKKKKHHKRSDLSHRRHKKLKRSRSKSSETSHKSKTES